MGSTEGGEGGGQTDRQKERNIEYVFQSLLSGCLNTI